MTDLFSRHKKVAFQFSGGRDSTAALYLMRPHWGQMTVYHLDAGDQFPETRKVVDAVERDVPIVRLYSEVSELRSRHGLPRRPTSATSSPTSTAATRSTRPS
ncbi:MAG: phosphoadenosine phosphosulfate reductase family protein [Ramlibacter sp.]|nr:phosphoadenosine phosphosulfate reductase family protein [Ramlibacter sp.]